MPAGDDAEQRAAAATRIRALSHALMGHRVPASVFARIIGLVDDLMPEIEASPETDPALPLFSDPELRKAIEARGFAALVDAGLDPVFGHTIVSGPVNPMGIAARFERDGDEIVTHVVLGRAFEGAPGRAHGGIVAAILDETLGAAAALHGFLAYTVELTVGYLRPTPIGVPVEFRAHLAAREGRRLHVVGQGRRGDEVLTEARGIFVRARSSDLP